jgi:UDP-hydrolysing UDP-N-acetyl-D-glucosamine 2-epimerase
LTRTIAVLTTGRQDWGILRSTCRALREDRRFDLRLLVGGMHWSDAFGRPARFLEEDGFVPAEVLEWIPREGPRSAVDQCAGALAQVGHALERVRPEALMLVGDRFETAAAAVAATLAGVPIVHLHGGEESQGAFDNQFRHAVTKLSHLHLVSHELHRARVIAMGEDPATIHIVGAPGLDNAHRNDLADRAELESRLSLRLEPPVVVVTLHPTTIGGDSAADSVALCAAMDQVPATYVITLPNTDPGHEAVRERLAAAADRPRRRAVEALGERQYWGLLRLAAAVMGNSSSALIEAPALGLPAVNVGDRQRGRLRGPNVIDAPSEAKAITAALQKALTADFRASLSGRISPLGDGRSAERIVGVLTSWTPPRPPVKRGATGTA